MADDKPTAQPDKQPDKPKAAAPAKKAEPKDPWEAKPVPPSHEEISDDPDATALAEAVEGAVIEVDRFADQITITVAASKIIDICSFLKTDRDYAFLVDLTGVHWPENEEAPLDVVYWLHRFEDQKRLRLKACLDDKATIASVSGIWKTANWMEREAYDMLGIHFEGHPNLERILTWENFNGHPLRKDFPVEGIDTGAAIYPDVFPPGGGPLTEEEKGRK